MPARETLAELLTADESTCRADASSFLADQGEDTDRVDRMDGDLTDLFDAFTPADVAGLSAHERELCRRAWVLDRAPLGVTVAGPVYQDTPIIYANRSFRELPGYSLADVRGENLRLLQGPDTEPGPVDSLREALDIWTAATVELWNYRADGQRFRNHVTLVPTRDADGMLSNWVGLQARVDE